MRTTLTAAALLGGLAMPAVAQERQPERSFTPAQLAERTLHRRAVEAVIF